MGRDSSSHPTGEGELLEPVWVGQQDGTVAVVFPEEKRCRWSLSALAQPLAGLSPAGFHTRSVSELS